MSTTAGGARGEGGEDRGVQGESKKKALCRTYGAPDFVLCWCSQPLQAGLTCAAPTALELSVVLRQYLRVAHVLDRRVEIKLTGKCIQTDWRISGACSSADCRGVLNLCLSPFSSLYVRHLPAMRLITR